MATKYLHSMIRTRDPEASIKFYTEGLGLSLTERKDFEGGRFSLYFLGESKDSPQVELTHNWDDREYSNGDNFGHLAYHVDNIYDTCERLQNMGIAILRPPRDGNMAFIKDPNGISIELLQNGPALEAKEPWASMQNQGSW